MASFEIAIEYVLKNEGGLEENPKDPAGITNFGISLRFLRNLENPSKYGFHWGCAEKEDIESLTIDKAKEIYKGEFWDNAPFDQIISQSISTYLLDSAVNQGISPAVKCIQRACWAVMHDINIIKDDGILGDQTLSIINKCSPYLLLPAMRSERAGEYRLLAERNIMDKEFIEGWLDRAYK